jgi:CheY-like chemotaxis protein
MSLASSIAPQLPYLRRFSRALTGSQQSGDAYVAALLEALIAEPGELKPSSELRVALYQKFCRLWESIPINMRPGVQHETTATPRWAATAQRHLSAIPPKAREAFLLLAVEGFTSKEISVILELNEESIAGLIDEASKAIIDQVATNVMIIEDEPLIAMDLRAIVETLGHTVTGVARTHREAAKLATKPRPGLILADIQLADGSSGIDAVNQILRAFEVPVIFITAFPERLLTGAQPEPTFLITKPFTPEMVKAVVSQALFFDSKAKAAA